MPPNPNNSYQLSDFSNFLFRQNQNERCRKNSGSDRGRPEDSGEATDDLKKTDTLRDPWDLPDIRDDLNRWSDLSTRSKIQRVFEIFLKVLVLIGLFYLFICSLDFLSSAFRLIGGKEASSALSNSKLLRNPVAGLMVGVLATVLLQSSSTSTSIVVSMVASGIISVRLSIPIVMGANIGTTVTNTFVSMAQAGDRDQFRRAFAAATVHDMFNWLTMIVLLPLEVATNFLYHLSGVAVKSIHQTGDTKKSDILKAITKPFTKLIIQLDSHVLKNVAKGTDSDQSLIKRWCKKETYFAAVKGNSTDSDALSNCSAIAGGISSCQNLMGNGSDYVAQQNLTEETRYILKCNHLFADVSLSDSTVGIILLLTSIVLLCACLIFIVKLLGSLLKGKVAVVIKKVINSDFPRPFGILTGYLAILVGVGLTIVVQSSSVFTSTLTPLVGVGVVSLERMYPLTLGSNIGTTATSIMASLAASGEDLAPALQIAFCHLFYNVTGILLWYPVPQARRLPITLAKKLGQVTAKYRWFSLAYLVLVFLLVPGLVFGLSLAGWEVLVGVVTPVAFVIVLLLLIHVLQKRWPTALPNKLKTWDFLPAWLRSLEPYDKVIKKIGSACNCCKRSSPASPERKPKAGPKISYKNEAFTETA